MQPFKSLIQFSKYFNTEEKCRTYLEYYRWKGTPICPHCGSTNVCRFANGKTFKCRVKECRKKFTATVGAVMESSKLPLTKWFLAIYVATNHSKGISSMQLANYVDVPQKTAWFLLHRVREMVNQKKELPLSGMVEADETYMQSSTNYKVPRAKHTKRLRGRSLEDKIPIVGFAERGGRILTFAVKNTKAETLQPLVKSWVESGSVLLTDDYSSYKGLDSEYDHKTVNHSAKQYVDGIVHTNTVEGYWSIYKRCIYGIYHSVSRKHVSRYTDEITYRYNTRKLPQDERFAIALGKCEGRLKYDDLILGDETFCGPVFVNDENVIRVKMKFNRLMQILRKDAKTKDKKASE